MFDCSNVRLFKVQLASPFKGSIGFAVQGSIGFAVQGLLVQMFVCSNVRLFKCSFILLLTFLKVSMFYVLNPTIEQLFKPLIVRLYVYEFGSIRKAIR
jgi:hypothetical protein